MSFRSDAAGSSGKPLSTNLYNSPRELLIKGVLGACALATVLILFAIVGVLLWESLAFFSQVPLREFFGETRWTPQFVEKYYGIWPLIAGTMLVTAIAASVALPVGLASAIYIAEYAPPALRRWLKPGLELLAGVPTVVYGYFALTFVTPLVQRVMPELQIYNALSAGIVVGIMIIPIVASLSEDALRAVPRDLAEGGYALGGTKLEVVTRIMVPAALSGIVASFILALSRAIGETMIVTLAAGATPRLTLNPLESIQTMTAYIVQVSLGDTPQGSLGYQGLFAVGLMLFLLTLVMNLVANLFIRRYREQY